MTTTNGNLEHRYQVLHDQYKNLKEEYHKLKQAYSQVLEQYYAEVRIRTQQDEEILSLRSQLKESYSMCASSYLLSPKRPRREGQEKIFHGKVPQVSPDESIEVEIEDLKLIEAFLILSRSKKGKTDFIYEFQKDSISNSAQKILADFCFPRSSSDRSFIFTLNTENETLNVSSSLPNSDKQHLYFICTQRKTDTSEEVYCLVSYVPFFEVHLEILKVLIQSETIPLPFLESCRDYEWIDGPIEITNLGGRFEVPSDLSSIDIPFLCTPLLTSMSIKDLLVLVCALLLEKSIIFIGEDIGVVSRCVLGLLTFLRPFKWPHITIPLVPQNLKELLEAPVPILAGYNESICQSEHVIYVDLDEPELSCRVKMNASDCPVPSELLEKFDCHVYDPKELAKILKAYWLRIIKLGPVTLSQGGLKPHIDGKFYAEDVCFIENVLQTQIFNNFIDEGFTF